jgi:phosphatidylinositol-4,5-bisphosphate 3-kinase
MKFSFALDLRMEGKDFIINECKVMDSKKLPLWLMVNSNCETYDKKIEKKEEFPHHILG